MVVREMIIPSVTTHCRPNGGELICNPPPAMAVQRGISFKLFADSEVISGLKYC